MKKKLISLLAFVLAGVIGTSVMFASTFNNYDCCDEVYHAYYACCIDCELKEIDTLEGAVKYLILGYSIRATTGAEEIYLISPSGDVVNIDDIVLSAGQVELVELFLLAVTDAPAEEHTMDVRFGRCCGSMTLTRSIAHTMRTSHTFCTFLAPLGLGNG